MARTLPIAFNGCAGQLVLPAGGKAKAAGVVLCRSWGIDELCTRKFFRRIADAFAARGFPVLAFDYPGTVDSLDNPESDDLESWTGATAAACDRLKAETGCGKVVLLGLGLGALIAARAAAGRGDLAGLILAAPVTGGRRFLRETGIKARVVLEGLGLPPEDPALAGETAIGGLVLPRGVAKALGSASLDTAALPPATPCLVVAREAVAGDEDLARQLGAAVVPFTGYEKLMENPTESVLPHAVVTAMADWLAQTCAETISFPPPSPAPALLAGDGFTEEGVVFRPDAPLVGILCRPVVMETEAPVAVFLNAGYDHHGGWARNWVSAARMLARQGIPSLRFDFAGVGDSPAHAGDPEQVLYTPGPLRDVAAALDFLESACPGRRPVLIGRCSGAYTAFHAGYRDPRVAALALVNQVRLVWDPEESLVDVSRMGPRTVSEYKRRLIDPRTLRRLLRGEVNVPAVLRGMRQHVASRLSHRLARIFPNISKYARFRTECHRMMRELDARGVPMRFLSSDRDASLEQLSLYFGRDRRELGKYGAARLDLLADADHNITPLAAQEAFRQWLGAVFTAVRRRKT